MSSRSISSRSVSLTRPSTSASSLRRTSLSNPISASFGDETPIVSYTGSQAYNQTSSQASSGNLYGTTIIDNNNALDSFIILAFNQKKGVMDVADNSFDTAQSAFDKAQQLANQYLQGHPGRELLFQRLWDAEDNLAEFEREYEAAKNDPAIQQNLAKVNEHRKYLKTQRDQRRQDIFLFDLEHIKTASGAVAIAELLRSSSIRQIPVSSPLAIVIYDDYLIFVVYKVTKTSFVATTNSFA